MSLWRRNIFRVVPRPFGLDLSDLSLKAVFLDEEGSQDRVVAFGSVALPEGAVVDGRILNRSVVVNAIKKLQSQTTPKPIYSRRVFCSLPETKSFLRIITLPKMKLEEVEEAVKWEIEPNIPLSVDQVYYDFQVLDCEIGGKQGFLSVLVVAVARAVVDDFVSVLEEADLEVVGFETESIAQARIFLRKEEREITTLIVDVGDRRTGFLIALGDIPVFTSSVSLSSQLITDSISKGFRISLDEAERMKLSDGIGSLSERDLLFRTVEPVLEGLVREISRSLDFYLNTLQYSPSVDRVILCGGGSNMKGFLPYLIKKLRKPVSFGNPWTNIRLGHALPPMEKHRSVQYSTALGLALRSLSHYENSA